MAILSFVGLPECEKMVAEATGRQLQNKMRQGARAGIGEFRTELRAEAAAGDYPRSFRKTTSKTTTRGGESGREIEAYVRPSSPLFNIFEPGASTHTIGGGAEFQMRAGGLSAGTRNVKVRGGRRTSGMLAGPAGTGTWDAGGRKRPAAFFARGAVSHPGMKARPLLAKVFNARVARAEDAVANAIFGHSTGTPVGA